MMFQRILVPLDGSKRAERAVPVAHRLAQSTGGTVILLRVVNTNWPSFSQSTLTQELPAKVRFEAEQYLTTIARSQLLQDVHTERVVPFGTEGATILNTAKERHADIIVINAHGYTGVSRWIMGSVADKVTRYAQMPVLLLREKSALLPGPHPNPSEPLRILVPLDGSALAMTALEPALELVTALSASTNIALHLAHVIDNADQLQAAKHYLQTIATKIRHGEIAHEAASQHMAVTWSVVMNADPADAIIHIAENGEKDEHNSKFGGCDLIAITTHGLTGLPFWTLGSTTEHVRAGTRLPLLIVRPTAMSKSLTTHHKYELASATSET